MSMHHKTLQKLNRESEEKWRRRHDRIAAKVGTVPMSIWVVNTTELVVGGRIKFAKYENGDYLTGYITKLEPVILSISSEWLTAEREKLAKPNIAVTAER